MVNFNNHRPNNGLCTKGILMLASVLFSFSALAQMNVNGRYLYDECGNKVVIRGTNTMTLYWDGYGGNGGDWSDAGELTFSQLALTGANTARIFWHYKHGTEGWAIPPEAFEATIENCVKQGMIAMPSLWEATGEEPKSEFDNIVDFWTQPAIVAIIKKYEDKFILNIANEWNVRDASGDASFSTVRKIYADAITRIRNAGIEVPIVIDGPERWSQNEQPLYDHAAYWLNHDPLKNVIFSMHMYDPMVGTSFPAPESRLQAIMDWFVSNNLCFIWGEFAEDGHNGNDIAFEFIMEYAQQKEIGWLAWVWWCCSGEGMRKTIARSKMYGDWYDGYASTVAVSSPYSIQNTSVKHQCNEPTPDVSVTGVSVSPTAASIAVGATRQLTATVSPSNAANKSVNWSSSNSSVATVNGAGLVTGVAAGNATVTATTVDGNRTSSSAITVTSTPPPPPPSTGTVFYEAEQNTSSSGGTTASFHDGYTGSGYYDFGGNGSYIEWNNISPGEGTYSILIRYANGSSANRPAVVTLNGTPIETVSLSTTNSWTNWWLATTESKAFNGGSNTIRITASTNSGGPNVDNILLTPTGANNRQDQSVADKSGQLTSEVAAQNLKLYPNPSTGMVRVLLPERALVQVHNNVGQLVLEKSLLPGPSTLDLSGIGRGIHVVSAVIRGRRQAQRLIIE